MSCNSLRQLLLSKLPQECSTQLPSHRSPCSTKLHTHNKCIQVSRDSCFNLLKLNGGMFWSELIATVISIWPVTILENTMFLVTLHSWILGLWKKLSLHVCQITNTNSTLSTTKRIDKQLFWPKLLAKCTFNVVLQSCKYIFVFSLELLSFGVLFGKLLIYLHVKENSHICWSCFMVRSCSGELHISCYPALIIFGLVRKAVLVCPSDNSALSTTNFIILSPLNKKPVNNREFLGSKPFMIYT